jgi:glycosyltransferase involved in cell wall biosynthesis
MIFIEHLVSAPSPSRFGKHPRTPGHGRPGVKSLVIRGPFRGPTGYDQSVRGFARELHRQGVDVELHDFPTWSATKLPAETQDSLLSSLERPLEDARTVVQFCLPTQMLRYPDKLNVNFTVFEATHVPAVWVRENRTHDLVIVPTESSREAWLRSGMPGHRVRVCPQGVDSAMFSGEAAPLPLLMEDGSAVSGYRTRFLNVAEFGARKNLMGLLHAWMEATSPEDDAVLIIKLGIFGAGTWERFLSQLDLLQERLGKTLADAAAVTFIRGVAGETEMPRFYTAATHYISLSFGEGWDYPMMEAAASGLKLIAPAHSAYLAYLDSSIATMIPSREIPAEDLDNPALSELFRGANWWEPDGDRAAEAIRAAIEGRDVHIASPRERIVNEFTWSRAASRLTEILDELESLRAKIPSLAALRSNKRATIAPARSAPDAPPDPNPS